MENSGEQTESGNDSDTDDSNEQERRGRRTHPEKVQMRAYDLSVEVQSEEVSAVEMADVAEEKMEVLMRHSLRGDLVNIEQNELTGLFFGGDR